MSIPISAEGRYLKTGKQTVFEPTTLNVKPWHPGHVDEQPGVLISRGRRQFRLNIEAAYELIDVVADILEQFDREETAMNEAYESRPYYTSEGTA
ncbi:hypothetical protein [Corynebacterium sp.]|uniref:hypothetical protein n=1 Tax=Corynebacterium sp. TaxID=1720 RepID=UPI0025BFA4AD|nr:hypothetical protein [Corynebacterium sp.]